MCSSSGYDQYYKSLRPRLDADFCNVSQSNVPDSSRPEIEVNCRNVWFREFWSQHNKCSFENGKYPKRCTGTESISDYEQEGLVPFVGEYSFFANPTLEFMVNTKISIIVLRTAAIFT